MSDARQQRVVEAIWPWREVGAAARPHGLSPARRAMIQGSVMGAIAILLAWRGRHVVLPGVILGLAVIVLLSGVLAPPIFLQIERFGKFLGRKIGIAVTWLLLVPFFAICFIPARLVLLAARQDPLKRRFPGKESTFWADYQAPRDVGQYRKQY